jgi:hypothetical protein
MELYKATHISRRKCILLFAGLRKPGGFKGHRVTSGAGGGGCDSSEPPAAPGAARVRAPRTIYRVQRCVLTQWKVGRYSLKIADTSWFSRGLANEKMDATPCYVSGSSRLLSSSPKNESVIGDRRVRLICFHLWGFADDTFSDLCRNVHFCSFGKFRGHGQVYPE